MRADHPDINMVLTIESGKEKLMMSFLMLLEYLQVPLAELEDHLK